MAVGTHCANHVTPLYPQKLALTSPTGGGLKSRSLVLVTRSAVDWISRVGRKVVRNFRPKTFLFDVLKCISPCIFFSGILINIFSFNRFGFSWSALTEFQISYLSQLYLNPYFLNEIWKIRGSSSIFHNSSFSKFIRNMRKEGTRLFVRIFWINFTLQYKRRTLKFERLVT